MKKEIEINIGSGNIFKDLGYSNAKEAQMKSDLALKIYQTIKRNNLTYKEAARILEIDEADLLNIIKGKLSNYPV